MTLAQRIIQKLGAFIAGGIMFTALWAFISPYDLLFGLPISERTTASVIAALATVLIIDSALGFVARDREGRSSKKPKHSNTDDDYRTAFLCPNCRQTFPKPVRIMDPKTGDFLYSVCPKCAKPLDSPTPLPPVQPVQPIQPMPPIPPVPAAAPASPPAAPAEVARALGVDEKPASERKPRLELKPDGTIIVYPGE
jgi:hypothetical protein